MPISEGFDPKAVIVEIPTVFFLNRADVYWFDNAFYSLEMLQC